MGKCVICGAEFPDAMVVCPRKDRVLKDGSVVPLAYFRKEICDVCAAADNSKSGTKYDYDCGMIEPYIDLAGAIERGVLNEYRTAYEIALDSAYKMNADKHDPLTEDELRFRGLHRQIINSKVHFALTMGNIAEALASVRREIERETTAGQCI